MLEDFDWERYVKLNQIIKWAYVSDLLPKVVRDEQIYFYHRDVELCPVCKKGMLVDGFVCPHCGLDGE